MNFTAKALKMPGKCLENSSFYIFHIMLQSILVLKISRLDFFFFFFFYVRAYLGINSMKLITNGKDHIVTADK